MPKIVDLDDIVINWAWKVIEEGRSKIFRGLNFDDLKFEINWDRVRFIASEPVYTDENNLALPNSQIVFKGLRLDLKLAARSKILAATAGFGKDWTLENSDESTREESIKWSINSAIRMQGKHQAVAELVVKEQQYTAAFNTTVRIRGRVIVMITNRLNNNSFLQCLEQDFIDIIKSPEVNIKHHRRE